MCHLTSLRDGLRILVVDSHRDSCELLAILFSEYAIETTIATCASEAIAAIHQSPPDLLISEIPLPDEDGYSLIKKVQALEAKYNIRIPAIALTTFAYESDRLRVLAAGFCRHLSKPFDPDELIATIACITQSSQDIYAIAC
jgi:two-component system, OmpR family, response regulator